MPMIKTTDAFDRWFAGLRDARARSRIQARVDRAEDGHLGDCEPIGEGVSEMRIDHGPGYRLYFLRRGPLLIVLLCGGNKRSQRSDIRIALQLARDIKR